MFTPFKFRLTAAALIAVMAGSTLTFADTLKLKDGSIIKGKITKFGGGKFTVAMGEGSRRKELVFSAGEIDTIQFDEFSPSDPGRTASNNTQPAVIPVKAVRSDDDVNRQQPVAMKPIEWKVKVLADSTANGWTNSGWVVRKGQRIRITGNGKVNLGRGNSSSPSGVASINDDQKLLKNVATGALIAVIGDDNNDFIYVGSEREFIATRDGALFLGINEGYLDDNSGSFDVKVEIIPDEAR